MARTRTCVTTPPADRVLDGGDLVNGRVFSWTFRSSSPRIHGCSTPPQDLPGRRSSSMGCCPPSVSLDLYQVSPHRQVELLTQRRSESVELVAPGLPPAVIRDQKPMKFLGRRSNRAGPWRAS